MSLAVRHKVTLTDYEMTTTLGTGKPPEINKTKPSSHYSPLRVFWKSHASKKQENR